MMRTTPADTSRRARRYPRAWPDAFVGATAAGSPADSVPLFLNIPAPAERRAGDALVLVIGAAGAGSIALPAGWSEVYRNDTAPAVLVCARTATADAADDVSVVSGGGVAGAMGAYRFDVPAWSAAGDDAADTGEAAPAALFRSTARSSTDGRVLAGFVIASDALASVHGSSEIEARDGKVRAWAFGGRPLPNYGVVVGLVDNLRAVAAVDVAVLQPAGGEQGNAARFAMLYEG